MYILMKEIGVLNYFSYIKYEDLCVWEMVNSIPILIKKFPQPPAEPSDNSDSHTSGNGYKATPVNEIVIYLIQIL